MTVLIILWILYGFGFELNYKNSNPDYNFSISSIGYILAGPLNMFLARR